MCLFAVRILGFALYDVKIPLVQGVGDKIHSTVPCRADNEKDHVSETHTAESQRPSIETTRRLHAGRRQKQQGIAQ